MKVEKAKRKKERRAEATRKKRGVVLEKGGDSKANNVETKQKEPVGADGVVIKEESPDEEEACAHEDEHDRPSVNERDDGMCERPSAAFLETVEAVKNGKLFEKRTETRGELPLDASYTTQKVAVGRRETLRTNIETNKDGIVTHIFFTEAHEPRFFTDNIVFFSDGSNKYASLKKSTNVPIAIYIRPIGQKKWTLYGRAVFAHTWEAPFPLQYVKSSDPDDIRKRRLLVQLKYE